jgi:hypothetical protein
MSEGIVGGLVLLDDGLLHLLAEFDDFLFFGGHEERIKLHLQQLHGHLERDHLLVDLFDALLNLQELVVSEVGVCRV